MVRTIVVGGGLAGLSAAHTVHERGGNVLLLDKMPFMGGNSTKATSGINGAGTNAQGEANVRDSAKAFAADTKKSARDLARDDLIHVLAYQSGSAVNWLEERFGLDLSKVARLGGHSFPRTHRGGAQFPGMTITYAEMEKLEALAESEPDRVQILKKADVKKLLTDNEGAVTGVEYTFDGQTYTELGPVVLATGGYAADFSPDGLLAKHRPDTLKLPTTNGPHCTGDGLKMAVNIGARAIDLEKVQVHPTGLVDPNEEDAKVKFLAAEALRGVGGILLDSAGDRFADELGHRDYVTGRMWENNKFPVRLVLNGDAGREIEWHCRHYVGRGLMKKIEGEDALAKEFGLPKSKLEETFADITAIADGKKKDPFGKKFFHNNKFVTKNDTYYVANMTPVLHYTMGGLEINPESAVVGTNGKPIPGLFACGEIGGGVHGANRLGGSSLLGCVVFGRVAGASACSHILQQVSSGKIANQRLGQIKQQLETKIRVDPDSKNVQLTFSWDEGSAAASSSSASAEASTSSGPPRQPPTGQGKQVQPEVKEQKEYTVDEVAAHKSKDDVLVVIDNKVLDVSKFLPDHPGGEKALMLYAGKEASEAFWMVHDQSVWDKQAKNMVVGTIKE